MLGPSFCCVQALVAIDQSKNSWGSPVWRAALNEAMGFYLDAADNYVKERSFKYTARLSLTGLVSMLRNTSLVLQYGVTVPRMGLPPWDAASAGLGSAFGGAHSS